MNRFFYLFSLVAFTPLFLHATESSNVEILMSVQVLNVELIGGSLEIPIFVKDNTVLGRSILKNTGNGPEDFALKISKTTEEDWQLVQSDPQKGEYRLHALWHQWDIFPSQSEFQDNDLLNTQDQTSSNTLFFNDSETHETNGVKGMQVQSNEERSLFIWVEGPSSGKGSASAHITVTALPSM